MTFRISIRIWLSTMILGGLLEAMLLELNYYYDPSPLGDMTPVVLIFGSIFSLAVVPFSDWSLKKVMLNNSTDSDRVWLVLRNCLYICSAVILLAGLAFPILLMELPLFLLLVLGYVVAGILSTFYFARKIIFKDKYAVGAAAAESMDIDDATVATLPESTEKQKDKNARIKIGMRIWLGTLLLGGAVNFFVLTYSVGLLSLFLLGTCLFPWALFSVPILPLMSYGLRAMVLRCETDTGRFFFLLGYWSVSFTAIFLITAGVQFFFQDLLHVFELTASYLVAGAICSLYFARRLVFQDLFLELNDGEGPGNEKNNKS